MGEDPTDSQLEQQTRSVRHFNRFYTRLIGLLHEGYLDSPFSLSEVRVLYELAHRKRSTAAELARELRLDRGYLSRMLRKFTELRLIARSRSETDGRQSILNLTESGLEVFSALDRRSRDDIAALLRNLPPMDRQRVVEGMASVEVLLGEDRAFEAPVLLRSPRPGDLGWVIQRHGAIYADEFGWDETFEALVADIVARYATHHDPKRERCWIAEIGGANVGSVFCVHKEETTAQLRLLLVEPSARGRGIGRALVDECIRFARSASYGKLVLWTNDVLVSARRIYEAAGFDLVEEEHHHSFGHDLVGQNWALTL